ncbi:MAG: iron dependent repressor, metal binding and dimerization domain protein [Bacillota bacterium]
MKRNPEVFRTFRGYAMQEGGGSLTPSLEDYLEMLFRLAQKSGYTRLNDLATVLNVQPASASKMVQRLGQEGLLKYERYGTLELTDGGRKLGAVLLARHQLLEEFLRTIGVTGPVLEDTERIEHNISEETLTCMAAVVEFARANPGWLQTYRDYLARRQAPGGSGDGSC